MANVNINSPTIVVPDTAVIDRVDQTITWKLNAPGLAWNPRFPNSALRFVPARPPYSAWPGQPPRPVGPPPSSGPDRRDYTATANAPMPNGQTDFYAYEIAVVDITTGEELFVRVARSPEELAARGGEFASLRPVQPGRDGEDPWYDPDIENRPQP